MFFLSFLFSPLCFFFFFQFSFSFVAILTWLVGRCRDRPSRALPWTCPNVKNITQKNTNNEKKSKQKKKRKNKMKRNASKSDACVSVSRDTHRSFRVCSVILRHQRAQSCNLNRELRKRTVMKCGVRGVFFCFFFFFFGAPVAARFLVTFLTEKF